MQDIKTVVRQLGIPSKELDVQSAEDVSAYLQYQYTSQGYDLHSVHFLGDVRNTSNSVVGYKFAYHFVKNNPEAKAK